MNILFFYTYPTIPNAGGVERVMDVLNKTFSAKKHNITIVYIVKENDLIDENQLYVGTNNKIGINKTELNRILIKRHIDVILNFAALFSKISSILNEICNDNNLPVVSIYHNTLDQALWGRSITRRLMGNKLTRKFVQYIFKIFEKNRFLKNMNYVSRTSSASIVLSKCYISKFKEIINRNPPNLQVIHNPNPFSLEPSQQNNIIKKENIVLFVGRLSGQKNLHSLIKIWSMTPHSDWKLYIVGDGDMKEFLMDQCKEYNVARSVVFTGAIDNPQNIYSKAKIFVMTSIYEGYPMTLIEAQYFGCVPLVFDNFPAAGDIIKNSFNGYLIPTKDNIKFSKQLSFMMNSPQQLKTISYNCKIAAAKYDIGLITKQWESLLQHLTAENNNIQLK